MPRVKKFRAWNGRSMQYGGFSVHSTGDIIVNSLCNIKEDDPVTDFTGVRDKDGCDIYDGDVVEDRFLGIGVVEFVEKAAAYRIKYDSGEYRWFIDYLDCYFNRLKVIGNKFTNRSLTNEKFRSWSTVDCKNYGQTS